MDLTIRMISAASETISYTKKNPTAIDEEIVQHIVDLMDSQRIKDQRAKLAMVVAASRAMVMTRKEFRSTEKELLKKFIEQDIPELTKQFAE
jgi:hypothetical protein